MWYLSFLLLDTTRLRSGDERSKTWLTEWRRVIYDQKGHKGGLLINATTVLPASSPLGHSAHTFSGPAEQSVHP